MRIVVIGGTGHIGTFLCPFLIESGHEVLCLTRGKSNPYRENDLWKSVTLVTYDKDSVEPEEFARHIAGLCPDVVIDLLCFNGREAKAMADALLGIQIRHYICCSSCWAEGKAERLPFDPDNNDKDPFCRYGRGKYEMEQQLLKDFAERKFPVSIFMPGHLSGAGWPIVNPWGNRLFHCLELIHKGEEICVPNFGVETLNHVHASDVARLIVCIMSNREAALGKKFYAGSGGALTTYGYAKLLYKHWGHEPKIGFLEWSQWKDYIRQTCKDTDTEDFIEHEIREAYLHLSRSGYFSCEEGARLVGYKPQHTIEETVLEAVDSFEYRLS